MNPQDPTNPLDSHFDPRSGTTAGSQGTSAGFCQQCGLSLTEQTRRLVGGAVYCEPCLAARIASASPGGPSAQPGYTPWTPAGATTPLSAPNPGLAALLGFIPGVGAMYNEQYAKGIAHLTIFALLVVLADANGIFGLFIAGWEFYMAIEAHHTARARRDGTMLPNPFGFNDLGERLGFHKGWAASGFAPGTPGPIPPSSVPSSQTPDNTDWNPGSRPVYSASAPTNVPQNPWSENPYPPSNGGIPYRDVFSQPLAENPYGPPVAEPIVPATPWMRVPAGAIWLILLGILFLLSTTGVFREFSGQALLGWGLIGLSGWIFLHRYKDLERSGLAPISQINRSLQGSVWVLTTGLLALLDSFHVLGWNRSWPIFIIVAGVSALLNRLASQTESTMPIVPGSSNESVTGVPR